MVEMDHTYLQMMELSNFICQKSASYGWVRLIISISSLSIHREAPTRAFLLQGVKIIKEEFAGQ
jgi:hypothetical protein